jgi:hypothetical protein
MKKEKVSNEKKNLSRLAGEFLVASRLTQRGYMVTLQWGQTIGYDILVFDKKGSGFSKPNMLTMIRRTRFLSRVGLSVALT